MDEEKKPAEEGQAPASEEQDAQDAQRQGLSRRQFLVGAGTGLVVGAAGAAGVISVVAPKPSAPAAVSAPVTTQPAAQAAPSLPPTMRQVALNIDGKSYDVTIEVRESLWEVMTYHLGMASSNLGCDRAQCGACTVVIDGEPVNSCLVLAARLGKGQKILTVDGISKGTRMEDLHPIAKATWEEGGFQCGACTRGVIMSTYALLTKNPSPSDADIQEALSGNICRCGNYSKIQNAVTRAAEDMRKKA